MEIESPTPAETGRIVELWLALAADQQRYGAHISADANRGVVAKSFGQAAVEGRLLVARESDPEEGGESADTPTIAGFASFRLETGPYEEDATRGLIENVYVVPERRSEGIGSALLSAAERRLAERGVTVVTLGALAANDRARSFYREHGYEPHRVNFEKPLKES